MKQSLKVLFASLLVAALCLPLAMSVCAASVSRTTMVRTLDTLLQDKGALGSSYTEKSPHGGESGSLGFAQTLFYSLYQEELPDLSTVPETDELLSAWGAFLKSDTDLDSRLPTVMGMSKFGDLLQYGEGGHIALILGVCKNAAGDNVLVVYDCGYGGDDIIRLRQVTLEELKGAVLAYEADTPEADEDLPLPEGEVEPAPVPEVAEPYALLFYRCNVERKDAGIREPMLGLLSPPDVTSYYLGTPPSRDGLKLQYIDSNVDREILADDEELKVYCNTDEPGITPMLFLYGSALTTTLLEVKEETVESISLKTEPTKKDYILGEEVDMTGAEVIATMKDKTQVTLGEGEYQLSYSFNAPGPAKVTLSYGNKTTSFEVNVTEPAVLRIVLNPRPRTTYFVGERLDLSDAVLLVYREGSSEPISVDLLESMLSTYDTSLPGEQDITVTYGGKTTSFSITVSENKVASLSVTSTLKKDYRKGAKLDVGSITLLVVYENGQSREISAADCTVEINGVQTTEFSEEGTANIKFFYNGVSTNTVAVTVTDSAASSFLRPLLIVLAILIGIPILVIVVILILRKIREKNAPKPTDPQDTEDGDVQIYENPSQTADTFEEVVSFDDIEDAPLSPDGMEHTIVFTRPEGPISSESTEDPTIRLPEIPTELTSTETRKIDFYDDL